MDWKTTGQGNSVLNGENFYISYNPRAGENPLAALCGSIGTLLTGNDMTKSMEETALYSRTNGTWHILNGDFRAEYETAFPRGFAACMEVYLSNHKHKSLWSTPQKVVS